jgi:hypothetical protein
MDNQLKVYQMVRYEETEAELEDEVDILMSSGEFHPQADAEWIVITG